MSFPAIPPPPTPRAGRRITLRRPDPLEAARIVAMYSDDAYAAAKARALPCLGAPGQTMPARVVIL